MPRRREVQKREILPDPKYHSPLAAKFVNSLMGRGKKSTAESILYRALEIIGKKGEEEPLKVFEKALEWELEVTARINAMMDIAKSDNDYAAQGMLQWFINEQVEEEANMTRFVTIAKALGEKNIFMLEGHVK